MTTIELSIILKATEAVIKNKHDRATINKLYSDTDSMLWTLRAFFVEKIIWSYNSPMLTVCDIFWGRRIAWEIWVERRYPVQVRSDFWLGHSVVVATTEIKKMITFSKAIRVLFTYEGIKSIFDYQRWVIILSVAPHSIGYCVMNTIKILLPFRVIWFFTLTKTTLWRKKQ